jgi:hypothetical protein
VFDFAGFADKKRTADDAHEGAAHELFFLPGAEFLNGFVGGVAEQGEIEGVLGLERGLGFDGVGAHAEDGDSEIVEILFCVAKLGRLYRSTGSVGFGVEEKNDAPAGEVLEGDGLAIIGLETEGGGFGAYFEHLNVPLGLIYKSLPRIEGGRPLRPGPGNSRLPQLLIRSIRRDVSARAGILPRIWPHDAAANCATTNTGTGLKTGHYKS